MDTGWGFEVFFVTLMFLNEAEMGRMVVDFKFWVFYLIINIID